MDNSLGEKVVNMCKSTGNSEENMISHMRLRYRSCVYPATQQGTVGKIYSPIFSFFQKRVVNIEISDLRSVSNESPGISHSICKNL